MGSFFSSQEIPQPQSIKGKNYDYYFTKDRFTYISRGYYPQFTSGYIWGRYEDPYFNNERYDI
tara:strand:+ start:995 stop:1183 length:189 start_codon:yes stop_codon:yes gene_type:complete